MRELYIGMMSGTSMDAIDAALVAFDDAPTLIAQHQTTFPDDIKSEIATLCDAGFDEINRMGRLDVQLGRLYGQCALELLQECAVAAKHVTAIGNHGQTIRHAPYDDCPFTLQIGDANVVAEITNITTVSDFRRRDLAVGGQGAPLVPAFHQAVFAHAHEHRVIMNIGGMANITILPPTGAVTGFDTGPGNVLMDLWTQRHCQRPFDHEGQWAMTGQPSSELLSTCLTDPYFALPPPKSTGRELFNAEWLTTQLANSNTQNIAIQDIQATLLELTAMSCSRAILDYAPETQQVFVCGGGAYNTPLLHRIGALCSPIGVHSTQALGVMPQVVESMAFAWLAKQTMTHKPGNLPSVTGASKPIILGAIHPA